MISSRSPIRAQVLALVATSLLVIPHVVAESAQGELAARSRQYSGFLAESDLACCPAGSTEKDAGSCCAAGLVVSQAPYIFEVMLLVLMISW